MIKDTSGPAFPIAIEIGKGVDWHRGMTLRDYFAAKAMQGLCAGNSTNAKEIAGAAYIIADAMLKAREA